MNDADSLRRLVLGLHPGAVELATLQTAAWLAKLLGLQLHAVFLESAASVGAAAFPFTRELRLPTHDWLRSDAERLRGELSAAAAHAESELARAGASAGVAAAFEIRHGDPVLATLELCGREDILAVREADAAFEGLTQTGARLRRAALASGANLLLLPRRLERHAGPIVAVTEGAAGAADPTLAIARRLAAHAGRELLVLERPTSRALFGAGQGAGQSGCLVIGSQRVLPDSMLEREASLLALPVLVVGERATGP